MKEGAERLVEQATGQQKEESENLRSAVEEALNGLNERVDQAVDSVAQLEGPFSELQANQEELHKLLGEQASAREKLG